MVKESGSIRGDLLRTAIALTEGDRNAAYGHPKENLSLSANLVGQFLGVPVSARDMAIIMLLVKVSRMKNPRHTDNYIDAAAYAAIAGELSESDE